MDDESFESSWYRYKKKKERYEKPISPLKNVHKLSRIQIMEDTTSNCSKEYSRNSFYKNTHNEKDSNNSYKKLKRRNSESSGWKIMNRRDNRISRFSEDISSETEDINLIEKNDDSIKSILNIWEKRNKKKIKPNKHNYCGFNKLNKKEDYKLKNDIDNYLRKRKKDEGKVIILNAKIQNIYINKKEEEDEKNKKYSHRFKHGKEKLYNEKGELSIDYEKKEIEGKENVIREKVKAAGEKVVKQNITEPSLYITTENFQSPSQIQQADSRNFVRIDQIILKNSNTIEQIKSQPQNYYPPPTLQSQNYYPPPTLQSQNYYPPPTLQSQNYYPPVRIQLQNYYPPVRIQLQNYNAPVSLQIQNYNAPVGIQLQNYNAPVSLQPSYYCQQVNPQQIIYV